ncbi:MAG: efflux RND transporter permease subunit, partial [Actinobacteria bacterium]|nr:efflux RND transporter permease subunit [Actinomycetota bacterium]
MALTYPSMPTSGGRILDRRKAAVLRATVREYVKTGQPVASKTLAQRYGVQASAATIRNDMSVLEELGYIVQPHTSAGRIPTDLGYRWFVDNWPGPAWPQIPEEDRRAIDGILASELKGLDTMLDSTSHVLSELTESAAVAFAPPLGRNLLRRLELIVRDARRATLLLIASNGEVEQGVVEFGRDRTEDELSDVALKLNEQLSGVENMIYFSSSAAADGSVGITATFEVGTDVDKAVFQLNNRVQLALPRLPDEVRRNGVIVQKRS